MSEKQVHRIGQMPAEQTALAEIIKARLDAFQNSTSAESAEEGAAGGHQC